MTLRTVTGILEWPPRTEGRVRRADTQELAVSGHDDPWVPVKFGDELPLRNGLEVTVEVTEKQAKGGGRNGKPQNRRRGRGRDRQDQHHARPHDHHHSHAGPPTRQVVRQFLKIEGLDPADYRDRPPFEELTVIDPQPRLALEHAGGPASCRLIDLFCPIGYGQRGLIVSPPKAGKTTLLKDITTGVLVNHPEVQLIVMLIDERPEEVTDFRRTFTRPPADGALPRWDPDRVSIVASSNDHDTDRHIRTATMAIERGKRMAEAGKHVVIVLDSLTRLGRAFNRSNRHASSGRTLSGGIDSRALEVPKQMFGAARNTEEAGSLTIIATCLVDTGSQGDQVIFEEFKGTGNMELVLDRKVAERRLFPAINLAASGTRKEDLLLDERTAGTMAALRRRMLSMPPPQQVEQLLAAMKRFETNAQLVGSAG